MEEKEQHCIFFNTCGAYIIQEKIKDIERITGRRIHKKKWSERFCFSNPENCIHFEDRKKKKKGFKKGA